MSIYAQLFSDVKKQSEFSKSDPSAVKRFENLFWNCAKAQKWKKSTLEHISLHNVLWGAEHTQALRNVQETLQNSVSLAVQIGPCNLPIETPQKPSGE